MDYATVAMRFSMIDVTRNGLPTAASSKATSRSAPRRRKSGPSCAAAAATGSSRRSRRVSKSVSLPGARHFPVARLFAFRAYKNLDRIGADDELLLPEGTGLAAWHFAPPAAIDTLGHDLEDDDLVGELAGPVGPCQAPSAGERT